MNSGEINRSQQDTDSLLLDDLVKSTQTLSCRLSHLTGGTKLEQMHIRLICLCVSERARRWTPHVCRQMQAVIYLAAGAESVDVRDLASDDLRSVSCHGNWLQVSDKFSSREQSIALLTSWYTKGFQNNIRKLVSVRFLKIAHSNREAEPTWSFLSISTAMIWNLQRIF